MGAFFQSAADDGAGTIQLASLGGDVALPILSLGSSAAVAADPVAEPAGAEHNGGDGTGVEGTRRHPATLRSFKRGHGRALIRAGGRRVPSARATTPGPLQLVNYGTSNQALPRPARLQEAYR